MKKGESKKTDDKRYIVCPVCGVLLAKSSDGTSSQQSCHRCGWSLDYGLLKDGDNGFVLTIKAQKKDSVKQ